MQGYCSRWLHSCRPTRLLVILRLHTWVNWFVSPIYLVGVPSALLRPIICWYRPWNCLLSAAGPSRSPDPSSGTACRTTWYLLRLCQPSVNVWKYFCSRPRSLTLTSISVKSFLYTFGGSWSDFITCTTLKIHGWLIEIEKVAIKMHDIPQRHVMSEWIFVWYLAAQSGRSVPLNRLLLWFLLDPRAFVPQTLAYIHCVSKKTRHQTLAHYFPKC